MGNNRGVGGITHLIFLTPSLYLFCDCSPFYWHELTQSNSKIVRSVHLFIKLHVHDLSTNVYIWCVIPFPFMLNTHDDITYKMIKGWFVKIQRTWIFIFINEWMVRHFFQIFFNYSLQYYLTQKHNLINILSLLSKSYSNHHPPLILFNIIFIWMKGYDNSDQALLFSCLHLCMFCVTNRLN